MSRTSSAVRFVAGVTGRRLRAQSGPLFYYGVAMTSLRLVRRFAGRRSQRLFVTQLAPGEGLQIRALRRGE